MANTLVKEGNLINITFDGATAWDITSATLSLLGQALPSGVKVKSLQMIPAATDDILIVREGSATGPILFKTKAANVYDHKVLYPNPDKFYRLYVVGNQATANLMLIVEI